MKKSSVLFEKGVVFDSPAIFRIVIQGKLDPEWSEQFCGMEITHHHTLDNQPLTILTGRLMDQAALFGILQSLYEMHLPLLEVKKME